MSNVLCTNTTSPKQHTILEMLNETKFQILKKIKQLHILLLVGLLYVNISRFNCLKIIFVRNFTTLQKCEYVEKFFHFFLFVEQGPTWILFSNDSLGIIHYRAFSSSLPSMLGCLKTDRFLCIGALEVPSPVVSSGGCRLLVSSGPLFSGEFSLDWMASLTLCMASAVDRKDQKQGSM